MKAIDTTVTKADEFQERHRFVAFPYAVIKKFGDDQAGNLAALIAYYGFLSLFPLLLVLAAVLGLVLRGNPDLQKSIVHSALSQFPVLGDQLQSNVRGLAGSGAGVALGVGTITALWAGLGVTQAAQNAMNTVWDVPRKERPNFVKSRLRGLLMLVVLGSFMLGATFLSGLGTVTGSLGPFARVIGIVGSLVLNLVIFLLAYRVLTDRDLSWRDVFPGAAFAGVVWTILQLVGTWYVNHTLKGASTLYGTFGAILGMLAWLYLGAQVLVYGAEINVVKVNRLWPRNLKTPPVSEADARVAARKAKAEERYRQEDVRVRLGEEVVEPEDRADVARAPGIEVEPAAGDDATAARDDATAGPSGGTAGSSASRASTPATARQTPSLAAARQAPTPAAARQASADSAGPGSRRRGGFGAMALGALGGVLLSWRRARRARSPEA